MISLPIWLFALLIVLSSPFTIFFVIIFIMGVINFVESIAHSFQD